MIKNLYRLLDCGEKQKLEYFGGYLLKRPCPQALWAKGDLELWDLDTIDAEFISASEEGKGYWRDVKNNIRGERVCRNLPKSWTVTTPDYLQWNIQPNDFGNVGVFTEHWTYAESLINFFGKEAKILNLFTYSGSNCVILAKHGLQITAVDSSRTAMDTYTANMSLNKIDRKGQKLVLEDCYSFIARETRRGNRYDAVMVDAPSYGRGTKGEIFNIENDLVKLVETCRDLMTPKGKLVLTLHSPRFTPSGLKMLIQTIFPSKKVDAAEIIQKCESGRELPSGFLVKVG